MALNVGIKHIRDGIEPQAVNKADMSVIGLIGTAPDATNAWELNKATELRTSDSALRAALGSTGTVVDALPGLSAQLSGDIGAARVVVVLVEEGGNEDETIANIIGSEALKSGVWQFLEAPEELGLTPRLIIVPGYTHQTANGLGELVLTDQGENLTAVPTVSFSGGGSHPNKVLPTAHAVLGTGGTAKKVVSLVIDTRGKNLSGPLTVAFAGGGSDGGKALPTATATVEQLANGVCATMPTILDRLTANFLPEGPTSSRQAAIDWLETLPRHPGIMHPLRQVAKVLGSDGVVVEKPLSPYIIGKYVSRDAEFDGVPGHSIANQSINGLVGVSPTIPMSLTDESVLGQADIGLGFGIVFRGDVGVDGALTDGGYTFWGTDNMSEASEWMFVNVKRMRDYLELMQVKAMRYYLGRFNITLQTVEAIINTMKSQLSVLRANGDILDFRVAFSPDVNSPEELRLGNLDLIFKAEEPPVLRKITLRSRRYREALENMTRQISVLLGDYA